MTGRKGYRGYLFLLTKPHKPGQARLGDAPDALLVNSARSLSERSINSEMRAKRNELCIGTGERIVPSRQIFVKLVHVVDDGIEKV